jgi:hypothetical protein
MSEPVEHPLAEACVAGFWCMAYTAENGVDVVVYTDHKCAVCPFAARLVGGRWRGVIGAIPDRNKAALVLRWAQSIAAKPTEAV